MRKKDPKRMTFVSKPITKYLEKTYGGVWTFEKPNTWRCDDGVRYVRRYLELDEVEECHHFDFYLYGEGGPQYISFLSNPC